MQTFAVVDEALGRALMESGAITEQQLFEAVVTAQRNQDRLLGDVLLSMGIDPRAVTRALEKQGFERADLSRQRLPVDVLRLLPEAVARRHRVLPLYLDGNTLVVAAFHPSPQIEQILTVAVGRPVRFAVAPPDELTEAIDLHYQRAVDVAAPLQEALKGGDRGLQMAVAGGENSAVARAVQQMLRLGVVLRASDIHLEPQPPNLRIRYRVDGVLQEGGAIEMSLAGPIISRIRILAGLDVVEHNTPQDGQFEFRDVDVKLAMDVRVNVLPTVHGPKVVMRLLDKRKTTLSLAALGMESALLSRYRGTVHQPFGMVLIVGPTGSGKSTTLYATIGEIDTRHHNVTTLEDPVEYRITGITQTQVNTKAGLTFAAGLRAILRQDPDIIVVGEIRDRETADIAVRAALTGHLVLATLHATDTVSTISRLIDIGVEPYLVSAALNGVLSQRLVRKVCPKCSGPSALHAQERAFLERLGVREIHEQRKGTGCNHCNFTGYYGREAVAEVLTITPELERLIAKGEPEQILRGVAHQQGLVTLQQVALDKVRRGITTVSDVMRSVIS